MTDKIVKIDYSPSALSHRKVADNIRSAFVAFLDSDRINELTAKHGLPDFVVSSISFKSQSEDVDGYESFRITIVNPSE